MPRTRVSRSVHVYSRWAVFHWAAFCTDCGPDGTERFIAQTTTEAEARAAARTHEGACPGRDG